jgi:hypothetical protein
VELVVVSPMVRATQTAIGAFAHLIDENEQVSSLSTRRFSVSFWVCRLRLSLNALRGIVAAPARVCVSVAWPAWLPSPQRTSVPFVAHEGAREPGGVHTCDQRWRLSDLKREFPFVDYSEVEPAVRSILVCQVHNGQMTCCYGSYIISSYLLYPPLHVPPRQCCSWPSTTHACTCGGGGCREKTIRCGIRLRCGTIIFPFSTTSLY